jgi:hypothetical protein
MKIVWRLTLVYRAYKICSNDDLFCNELSNITKFAFWNGFSKRLSNELLESLTPKLHNTLSTDDDVVTDHPNNTPTIWIHLHYLSLVKEGAPLFTTPPRKLNVYSSNLLNSSPYGTPLMHMPS